MKAATVELMSEDAKRPKRVHSGDAGLDLFVSRECVIEPNEVCDVHTDIRIKLPEDFYMRITGRSSSLHKHNLLVNEGIIDNGYTGELYVCVKNLGDKPFHVERGMRLAQILFHRIEDVCLVEGTVTDGERGSNGFGSTGT